MLAQLLLQPREQILQHTVSNGDWVMMCPKSSPISYVSRQGALWFVFLAVGKKKSGFRRRPKQRES